MLLFIFILKYQQNKTKSIRYKITIFIYIFYRNNHIQTIKTMQNVFYLCLFNINGGVK